MVLIIVIATAALLLSGFGIVLTDAILFHGYLQRDLTTFARIIADNSTAVLTFDDTRAANDILGALRARSHVLAACLYTSDGARFAEYLRPGAVDRCAVGPAADGASSTVDALTVNTPVVLDGRRIGSLMIVYDLGEMRDRVLVYGLMVVIVLAVSALAVVLLSSRLRTMFVTPILKLAEVTEHVSRTKDYSARADKLSNDEVGALAAAFNEMLAGIESRDAELLRSLSELQKSNEELARSNRDLERFAFIASHDLQEPLRMVTIYSQLLVAECSPQGGRAAEYCEQVVGGTRRMRDLLADILAYVEVTREREEFQEVDVGRAIEKVKDNLSVALAESGGEVIVGPMPVLRLHEGHLISLFQNLIGNSLKYRGPEAPRIAVSSARAEGFYRFSVSDNGIGIAPEYHEKIFLAFTRLHGKEIPGTGIGLAICQRVVERYGGRIWVESEEGKGAAFLFTLPVYS